MRGLDTSQTLANDQAMAQFNPNAWQQATQIYQDPLAKAQAGQQQASAQSGVGAQYGALGNAYTNYGNQGAQLLSQALPWLAASAPQMPPTPQTPGLGIQPVNISALGSSYNNALNSNYANQLAGYNAQLSQNQNML